MAFHVNCDGSKCDIEIFIVRIDGNIFDLCLADIAGKGIFNIFDAVINVLGVTLGEHLDGAVRQVADISFELIEPGDPVGGESKADSLYTANENDMFGNHSLPVP